MGLFDFMKKKGISLAAPVKGECIPVSEVEDPTFAEEILGKGIAIKPSEGKFYACRWRCEHRISHRPRGWRDDA